MKQRIYLVTIGDNTRMVRASSQAQAVTHVARSMITVRLASQDDIVEKIGAGIPVEQFTPRTGEESAE